MMVFNDKLTENDDSLIPKGKAVYEVIRIIERTPLFFNGHALRLNNTLKIAEADFRVDTEVLRKRLKLIIDAKKEDNYNIKILIDRDTEDMTIIENPFHYPEKELYVTGIHTDILKYERPDPNAKIVNSDLISRSRKMKEETGAYELLLEDHNGNITEGSISNVFFLKGRTLITPPVESVLPGITRQEIIKCAKDNGFEVKEETVNSDNFSIFEAAFISGTSPKILPINSIKDHSFNPVVPENLKILMDAFNQYIEKDLESFR